METKKEVQSFLGHNNLVQQLQMLPQGNSFFSLALDDRFIDIWTIKEGDNDSAPIGFYFILFYFIF